MSKSFQTSRDLFNEVQLRRDVQCRRRLFYFSSQEVGQQPSLLMLHKAYALLYMIQILSIISLNI
jgi:hypothetical protein